MNSHDWHLTLKPRAWQSDAFNIWRERMEGVVSVVTGGGKTVFAEICMVHFADQHPEGRIAIVAPTKALVDQWVVSLEKELQVKKNDISIFSGEEKAKHLSRINIFVINTARQVIADVLADSDSFLIVDECHRAGAPINARALEGDHIATLGLSATPEREYDSGFSDHIEPKLGPVIFEYGYADARRDGIISPFHLINVEFQLLPDEEVEHQRLTQRLFGLMKRREKGHVVDDQIKITLQKRANVSSNSPVRIPLAVKLVEGQGTERCIVFHERISAAEILNENLNARGLRSTSYHSKIGPSIRRDNLALFREGRFDVLVCCKALDEGLNVPEASTAVIASSTASIRQRIQRLGRVLRPAPGKSLSTIYTLFATKQEKIRLQEESNKLSEVANITWKKSTVNWKNSAIKGNAPNFD